MSELFYKNFQKVDNIKEVYNQETNCFIYGENQYPICKVPMINQNFQLSFLQKGNKEYFGLCDDEQRTSIVIVLEENTSTMEIENLYLGIESAQNSYVNFFANPSVGQLIDFLKFQINEIVETLPNTEEEINMYKDMLNKYIVKVTTLVVNKQKMVLELKEKIKEEKDREDKENKPFVTGQENWYKGKCYTKITEISKDYNIGNSTLYSRRDKGMSIKEMIETPVAKRGRGARK